MDEQLCCSILQAQQTTYHEPERKPQQCSPKATTFFLLSQEVDEESGDITLTYYVRAGERGKRQIVVERVGEMYKPPCLRSCSHFRDIKQSQEVEPSSP